jgi:ribonuclease HI
VYTLPPAPDTGERSKQHVRKIELNDAVETLRRYAEALDSEALAITVEGKTRFLLAPVAELKRLGLAVEALDAAVVAKPEAVPNRVEEVAIYTDGGCIGNPGPGGYGAIVLRDGRFEEVSGGYRLTTNNRMEIMAAIAALESLAQRSKARVYSDSQYLVNAMEQGWLTRWRAKGWMRGPGQPALNVDLWERMLAVVARHEVRFEWVRGHLGDPFNERAHALSVGAAKRKPLPPDPGYFGT